MEGTSSIIDEIGLCSPATNDLTFKVDDVLPRMANWEPELGYLQPSFPMGLPLRESPLIV